MANKKFNSITLNGETLDVEDIVATAEVKKLNSQLGDITKQFEPKYFPKYKGVNVWLSASTTKKNIDNIVSRTVELGINSIFVCVYHQQVDNILTSNLIEQIVSDEIIEYLIDKAKENNIEFICIKPHCKSNSNVNPSDKELFLENWFKYVKKYAVLSVNKGLEKIIISNELSNLDSIENPTQWQSFINEVKGMGLKVGVTFAGINGYDNCNFIQALDFIGINYYPRVLNGNINMSTKEVKLKLIDNIDYNKLNLVREENKNKEIYISEIGCTKFVDGMTAPSAWEFENQTRDNKVQELYYTALYLALGERDITDGIYLWCVDDYENEESFNPYGNPLAEKIIKSYKVRSDKKNEITV